MTTDNKITDVQIVPIKPNKGLIAIASIVVNDSFYLGGIGVHTRLNGDGIRLTYPTKKVGDRDINIYHPIQADCSKLVEFAISAKYKEIFGDITGN